MKIYNGDTLVIDVNVDDDSYRYRAVMGENTLVLKFSLPQHVEIPVGSYCKFQDETYTLIKPENLKMNHTRSFEYIVEMHSSQSSLSKYKFRNTVDSRLKFSLTARPEEHLQMLVDNLNARESGWTIGECVDSPEKVISYNHTYLLDALEQMAETFGTEWEISGKTISLHKVEYNKENPLALGYGKGHGFKPGVGRTNFEDSVPTEILYTQGGNRNIDASKYGNSELLLPKLKTIRFDGTYFEDEVGFDASRARTYVTDADGYSIRRKDKELKTNAEDSLDCSEIYPHRDEKILKVIVVDKEENWYDVVTDAPESLDYSQYSIGGERATIKFQSGMLAGREFEVKTDKDGNIICEKYYDVGSFLGWKFQILPVEQDGITMPGESYIPAVDDVFRFFGIQLPDAYIEEDATKSGASWEMFREGVKCLYNKEDEKFTFTGTLDGIWTKQNWIIIGGNEKIRIGGFVSFTNEQIQPEPVLIRITGIKDYVNNPYSPEIELSNSTKGISVSSELNKIASNEERTDGLFRDSVNFTKRRFRDAKETISMLEEAMLTGFTDSISPLTVQTMMMLVGDQSLQFRFVDSKTNPQQVVHNVEYDDSTKILSIDGGTIQHMTLGIDSVSSGHGASEYKFWTLPAFDSPILDDITKKYYIYAKVSRTDETGSFCLSETAKSMESESGYYYLLVGLLNSEYDGTRSYVSLYGFTEILPGQITTDVIRDTGGNLIIDLVNRLITVKNGARIDGNISIGSGSSGLENLSEWAGKQDEINSAQQSANDAQSTAEQAMQKATEAKDYIDNTLPDEIANINKKLDGVVETWFYPYSPTLSNEPAASWIKDGEQKKHIGDMFLNNQEYVDDKTTPDAGKAWRWEKNTSGNYFWNQVADSDSVKALQKAAAAQDTADQKRRVFVTTPYTPYDVGDMWTAGPTGDIMRCIKARATGNYAASDWDKASKYTDDTAALAAQAAASAASQAAQAAQSTALSAVADAAEANKQLTNLMSDSVITPPEKTALKQQHSDIKAEYSQIIADAQKYGVSTTAYTKAYNSANTALTKYTAATPENITVGSDYSNISAYYTARQTILNTIAAAAKKVADAAQDAANAAQDAANAAQSTANAAKGAANSAQSDINAIKDFTNKTFADGVIDRAEAASIEKYKNSVNETLKSVTGTYNTLYANTNLTGTAKTALKTAYDNLTAAIDNLLDAIDTAIADSATTDAEKKAVDDAYAIVNTRIQTYNEAVEDANDAIQDYLNMKANILASASMGNMLYTDPEFKEGVNSIAYYKRYGSSATVTLTRKSIPGTPNTSGYGIEMVCPNGEGGFRFGTLTRANRMLVCRFVAKIPAGRQVMFATNSLGDNNTSIWLTSDLGTGEWEEYAYYVKAGNAGTFSTTFFFYIKGTEAVTWYLAYATVFDLSAANSLIEAVAIAQSDLHNLSEDVSEMDKYIDGAFRDGVINDAESIAIKKYLNTVNESWADLQASYNVVYNNSSLTGTPKTNLKNAYNTLSTRKTSLVNAINTAVSNPSSANITAVDAAFTNYNSAVGTFKNALENANKSIQDGIRDDVSDLDYLKNTFGYVVDVNGVVLGKLVAVKDDNGNVQAMLNGSTLGKDSVHGKLLLALGIKDISHPETARTRHYEDGYILGDVFINSGKIGGFYVTEKRGLVSDPGIDVDEYAAINIGEDYMSYVSDKADKNQVDCRSEFTVSYFNGSASRIYDDEDGTSWQTHFVSACPGAFCKLHVRKNYQSKTYYGQSAALTVMGDQDSSEDARGYETVGIKCVAGMFSGLRPYIKTISSNYTLTYLDHTILVDTTDQITINLPKPGKEDVFGAQTLQLGQEYLLVFNGGPGETRTIVLEGTSANIHMPLDDKWSVSSINLTRKGMVKIIYAPDKSGNGRWWVTRLA